MQASKRWLVYAILALTTLANVVAAGTVTKCETIYLSGAKASETRSKAAVTRTVTISVPTLATTTVTTFGKRRVRTSATVSSFTVTATAAREYRVQLEVPLGRA